MLRTYALSYLASVAPAERTTAEVHEHLLAHTPWGQEQLGRDASDRGRRSVLNALNALADDPVLGACVRKNVTRGQDARWRHSGTESARRALGGPEETCLLLLAEKFLAGVLPDVFREELLARHFREAHERLARDRARHATPPLAIPEYLGRLAIVQRGQPLVGVHDPEGALGIVARAIVTRRQIEARYHGRVRRLHPYGLILAAPKAYLLAAEERDVADTKPKLFLVNRLHELAVGRRRNRVPEGFDVDRWLAGHQNVIARSVPGLDRHVDLELHLHPGPEGGTDGLLRDLAEFRLCAAQRIEPVGRRRGHRLHAPSVRVTHQLVEWLLGRGERVEVIAPTALRAHVRRRARAIAARYAGAARERGR